MLNAGHQMFEYVSQKIPDRKSKDFGLLEIQKPMLETSLGFSLRTPAIYSNSLRDTPP